MSFISIIISWFKQTQGVEMAGHVEWQHRTGQSIPIPEPEKIKVLPQSPLDLWGQLMENGCIECHQSPPTFIEEGPIGGIFINIFCSHCGQGYNISPLADYAEKIHRRPVKSL
jgi:hypothetical protein